jgi:hypothetical protein
MRKIGAIQITSAIRLQLLEPSYRAGPDPMLQERRRVERGTIERRPERGLGGKPTVARTRLSVELILEKLAAGERFEDVSARIRD